MEVVSCPRRHDVAPRGERASTRAPDGATGWSHQASDGDTQMWVRDRIAAGHARLPRTTGASARPASARPIPAASAVLCRARLEVVDG